MEVPIINIAWVDSVAIGPFLQQLKPLQTTLQIIPNPALNNMTHALL